MKDTSIQKVRVHCLGDVLLAIKKSKWPIKMLCGSAIQVYNQGMPNRRYSFGSLALVTRMQMMRNLRVLRR